MEQSAESWREQPEEESNRGAMAMVGMKLPISVLSIHLYIRQNIWGIIGGEGRSWCNDGKTVSRWGGWQGGWGDSLFQAFGSRSMFRRAGIVVDKIP